MLAFLLPMLAACEKGGGLNPYEYEVEVPTPRAPQCGDPLQASGFTAGIGSDTSPHLICNYEQLNMIRNDISASANYALGQDIDASPSWSEGTAGCNPFDGNSVAAATPCEGWQRIAGTFEGSLDGKGFAIRSLYSNRDIASIFFENLVAASRVVNIGFIDFRVRFSGDDGGFLAFEASGTAQIQNVYLARQTSVFGLSAATSAAAEVSGALIGRLIGTSRMRNSFTAGFDFIFPEITQHFGTGFIAAEMRDNARIENCYARGDLDPNATMPFNVVNAGLITATIYNTTRIENVYTTGDLPLATAAEGALIGNVNTAAPQVNGTNYFVSSRGGANGIDTTPGSWSCTGTCMRQTLVQIQQISTLPADWSADDWDLRGPTQVPALRFGGGPAVCGELCGQLIPNQPD